MVNQLLLLILLTVATTICQAKQLDLGELSEPTQKLILSQFPILNSENFTRSDLDQVLRYLINQEVFDSVEIRETSSEQFKFFVGKTKKIAKIKITGNSSVSESDIRRELALSEKSIFDQQLLIIGGDRLRKFYNERAYNSAIIDIEFYNLSAQELEVRVLIKEGKQTLLKTIDVDCDNEELRRRIEKIVRHNINEPLTESNLAEMRKTVREDFSEQAYLKAELTEPEIKLNADESEAQLKFRIERPIQYSIQFRGNSHFWNYELNRALDVANFYSSNPNIAPELASKIKNFYLSQGYARAEVEGEELELGQKFKRSANLLITEGPLVMIKNIDFSGRLSQTNELYQKILMSNASELIQKNRYVRDDLEIAFKNLVIERQNQGYLKAKIVSSRSTYNKERDQVSIAVNFDEGPLTSMQKIEFQGVTAFTETELKKVLGLEVNQPLKLSSLEEALLKLKTFYHDNGYLEMALLNEREDLVTYSQDNTLASLNLRVYEGPKVTVGSIVLEGNGLTKDYVILTELEFKVGDTLTPQNLQESIRRLQSVGHFNSVDIRTLEEKTQVGNRTVVVRVTDRDPGLFNFGAGLTNERNLTLRGFTGLAYRNIGGTGRAASLRGDFNYNVAEIQYLEKKGTFGYLEPYLFMSRNRGKFNYTQSNTINVFKNEQGVELRQFDFAIEQDITSHLLVSWDLLNKSSYRDYFLYSNVDVNSRTEIATIGPTLDLDYRDDRFNPTKGTFSRINLEYASPALGSSETIEYIRGTAGVTLYTPLSKKGTWVWANSWRGAYLKNMSSRSDGGVPWDKKGLILGGQSTVRGFTPGEAFPNSSDFYRATVADGGIYQDPYLLKTWATSFLIKSELRFPIYGSFGGAVFYDGGSVRVGGVNFEDYYRDAIGVAFRYATPVGAVSLEWGYKLDRNASRESQFPFHFSIGTF